MQQHGGGGGAAALKEFQHRVVTVGAGAAMPTFCWSDVRCQTSKKLPPSAILSTSPLMGPL